MQHVTTDCETDEAAIRSFCRVKASAGDNKTSFQVSTCQLRDPGSPNKDNRQEFTRIAATKLSAPEDDVTLTSMRCNPVGQPTELTVSELKARQMSSSCGPVFDLNNVTGHVAFSCQYKGAKMHGSIASCDVSGDDRLDQDILKLAHDHFGGKSKGVDKAQITCSWHDLS